MVRECCGEKQTKSCPSFFCFLFFFGCRRVKADALMQVSPLLCGLVQQCTDPHSSLSALMMCASAGPLQAQRGPVYQHSCPGYRPITQCQCIPHWLSVRLQSCATDRGRSWLIKRVMWLVITATSSVTGRTFAIHPILLFLICGHFSHMNIE